MRFQVRFEKKAEKDLDSIPKIHKARVLAVLPAIAQNPYLGKKLDGELYGSYSYRVWPYRIIYKIFKEVLIIVIIKIKHRGGGAYR